MTDLTTLTSEIEKLSNKPPMWSRSTYTHRGTPHVVFLNGAIKAEGELPPPSLGSIDENVAATLDAVKRYRGTIHGKANLVWRIEPHLIDEQSVYCRLCFEVEL